MTGVDTALQAVPNGRGARTSTPTMPITLDELLAELRRCLRPVPTE